MKDSLINSNPYLKDPAVRKRTLTRNVESSSAIEGIRVKCDFASGRCVASEPAVKNSSR
jgi:hypothetical protein